MNEYIARFTLTAHAKNTSARKIDVRKSPCYDTIITKAGGRQRREVRFVKKKFYMSLAALITVISGILLFNVFSGNSLAALPRDCDNNSIIHCGAITPQELTQRYNENKTGDLAAVYNHYGISGGMVAAGAPMGEVHKDGRVTLNGETVATDAQSIGRKNIFSGSKTLDIGGKTYYETPPSRSFARDSIAAYVFLDKDGRFISAILTSCGNPVSGKPIPPKKPVPTYKCVSLTSDKISRNEYSFKAMAEVTGGAVIAKYHYDFGDGKTESSTSATIKHTYEVAGTYTAKLSVDIHVGDMLMTVTAPSCQVMITVDAQPVYKCDALTMRTVKLEDRTYAFDLAYTATGGASLKTVDYEFGDGQGREGATAEEAKSVTHSYAKAGTYTTTATLHFADPSGTIKDDECKVTITTSPEMCPLNPSLPKNDERCAPCPIPGKEQYPKDSPHCVTPPVTELPKTGPMDLIGGGLGLSSLVAASYYWYASRRGLLNAFMEL